MRDKVAEKVEDIKERIMDSNNPSPARIRTAINKLGEDVFYSYLDVPIEREILANRCIKMGAKDLAEKFRNLD